MKYVYFVFFLMFSKNVKSQMNELFYGSNWSNVSALTDSVLKVLPLYTLEEAISSKSNRSQALVFKNASDKRIKVDILRFSDRIGTIQMTGNFEAVMAVYSAYVLRGKKIDGDHVGNCWPVTLLTSGLNEMSITFCKNVSKSDSWTLANKIPIQHQ